MKEIPGTKKMEVAQRYLLGLTYKKIEEETGVSHGSVVNIVKEIGSGNLNIRGAPFDQINELRQLSLDLKKKGLSISQALLGLSFFERTHDLGIVPEYLDQWAELTSKLTATDLASRGFSACSLKALPA